MKTGKASLINLTILIVLVAIAIGGHHASPLLLPKADIGALPEPGCDLQQRPCAALVPGGGRIELSITPRPIPFLAPLQVSVVIEGMETRKVALDFAGESMNMGLNRSELTAAGAGRFKGDASLPVCVTGRMAWIATVLVETDRQRIAVPYRFEIGH